MNYPSNAVFFLDQRYQLNEKREGPMWVTLSFSNNLWNELSTAWSMLLEHLLDLHRSRCLGYL